MNRRNFLAALGFGTVAAAAAANHVLDIERLLWIPGEKTIFIPNEIDEDAWLWREALQILDNNLRFMDVHRYYDDSFVIGQTVRVALPQRFAV